jgi:hypothetical protein
MDDLIAFLRARLDEDARAAREAIDEIVKANPGTEHPGEWRSGHIYLSDDGTPTGYEVWADDDPDTTVISVDRPLGAHIARHDPARVLADVAVKRRIVDRCQNSHETMPSWGSEDYPGGERSGLYQAVQLLALPYAGHPDYREEWRP